MLKYAGPGENGDRLYLCRCHLCGGEKVLPASTIRAKLASCGCRQHPTERMKAMSQLGVAAAIVDGANIPGLARKEARDRKQEELLEKYNVELEEPPD